MSDDTPDTNFKVIDTRSPETRARVAGEHIGDVNKMVGEALKPCPFCGGEAVIGHFEDVSFYVSCKECNAGIDTESSRGDAIAAWNRRAPEPMTSVVRWTRIDGTLKTLPEDGKDVLVVLVDQTKFIPNRATVINFWPKISEWEFLRVNTDIQKGDLWAYLPQPPEGAE